MTDSYETVTSELDDAGIRTLLLNRPQRLNAMNRQLLRDVTQAFDDANADDATRVILFSGAGTAFCAGDDRHEHQHPASAAEAQAFVELIQGATRAIVLGAKPVVGAINGWAVGGGFEWAINCDFAIWAQSARGFFPEVSLNLFVTGRVTNRFVKPQTPGALCQMAKSQLIAHSKPPPTAQPLMAPTTASAPSTIARVAPWISWTKACASAPR